MRTGRPKKALEMCDDDREKLTTIARRPKSSQALAMRARIVLDCARGLSNSRSLKNCVLPARLWANGGSGFGSLG